MSFLKERIWSWGYVLDKVPSAAPFTFEKTRCSLETQAAYLGTERLFYMNSMFNRQYVEKYFPEWDREILTNCIDNRLSDGHFSRMRNMRSVFCTLEHNNYLESAIRIAKLSLKYPNIVGVNFDDFNKAHGSTTLPEIDDKIKDINPNLKISIVTYSSWDKNEYLDTPKYVDVYSRWCWVAAEDYWRTHETDIQRLREITGPDKSIIQGIYIHDFGSSGLPISQCLSTVPFDIFQKSVETICENTFNGIIDGFIIPQAAYFSAPSHKKHVCWLKDYIDWFDSTTTVL